MSYELVHVHFRKDGHRLMFCLLTVCLANSQGYTHREFHKLAEIGPLFRLESAIHPAASWTLEQYSYHRRNPLKGGPSFSGSGQNHRRIVPATVQAF